MKVSRVKNNKVTLAQERRFTFWKPVVVSVDTVIKIPWFSAGRISRFPKKTGEEEEQFYLFIPKKAPSPVLYNIVIEFERQGTGDHNGNQDHL
jgi:hypothetical protein